MSADPDPGDATDAQRRRDHLGDAEVLIDVDRETYTRLRRAYRRAVEDGYPESFDVFAFNRAATECYVTVGGQPVAPDADPVAEGEDAAADGGTDT